MIILQKRIYRSDLRMNPKVFYVFGDNMEAKNALERILKHPATTFKVRRY